MPALKGNRRKYFHSLLCVRKCTFVQPLVKQRLCTKGPAASCIVWMWSETSIRRSNCNSLLWWSPVFYIHGQLVIFDKCLFSIISPCMQRMYSVWKSTNNFVLLTSFLIPERPGDVHLTKEIHNTKLESGLHRTATLLPHGTRVTARLPSQNYLSSRHWRQETWGGLPARPMVGPPLGSIRSSALQPECCAERAPWLPPKWLPLNHPK